MEYKLCTVEDLHTLRDLAERTYRETFAPFNTEANMEKYVSTALSAQQLARELCDENSLYVLALQDGQAAGYAKLNYGPAQTELQDDSSLEIQRIYALQSFYGKGVGPFLMDYALDRAQREGKAYVWLGVWEKNPRAIRFYEKNGFTRFGEHTYWLGDDKQLDYLMRKDLAPQ